MTKALLATLTLAAALATGGCSHESQCKGNGGKVQSQNVYDDKGNYDHEHFQCVTAGGKVVDEWDSRN